MDTSRLRRLAGVENAVYEDLDRSAKELDELLDERIHMGSNMAIDTDEVDLSELTKRLNAARRGLQITTRLPSGPEKIKHFYRIAANMETIEQALRDLLHQEETGEKDVEEITIDTLPDDPSAAPAKKAGGMR